MGRQRAHRSASWTSGFPFLPRYLECGQQRVEALVALLPVLAVADEPLGRRLEGIRLEMAEPCGGLPRTRDEPGGLEHLEVLGDGRLGDVERCGQLEDA